MADVDRELNWAVLLDAIRTAQTCCEQWRDRSKLTRTQAEEILADLQAQYSVYSQDASSNGTLPISAFCLGSRTKRPAFVVIALVCL